MTIYLYVKRHPVTGLKYFGKTSLSDPYRYPGSGKYWSDHTKKHDKHLVETLQVWEFEDQELCTEFALKFSQENDIVNSKDWANLIVEDGKGGGCSVGPKTEKHRINISKGRTGIVFSESHLLAMSEANRGKFLSEEHKQKISSALTGKRKSEDHQAKITAKMKGRVFSEEIKIKMSEAAKNRHKRKKINL